MILLTLLWAQFAFAQPLDLTRFTTSEWIFHEFAAGSFFSVSSGGAIGVFVRPDPEADTNKIFVYTAPSPVESLPRSLQSWRKQVYVTNTMIGKPEYKAEVADGNTSYQGQLSFMNPNGLNVVHVLALKVQDSYYLFIESHIDKHQPDPYASVEKFYSAIRTGKHTN